MYMFEKKSGRDSDGGYEYDGYELVAEDKDELKYFIEGTVSTLLGAMSVGDVSDSDGLGLLRQLVPNIHDKTRMRLHNNVRGVIGLILSDVEKYSENRQESLMAGGKKGEISSQQIVNETVTLDGFYDFVASGIKYLSQEGYESFFGAEGMWAGIHRYDATAEYHNDLEEDSPVPGIIESVGANAYVAQYARNDTGLEGFESFVNSANVVHPYIHTTIGTLDAHDNFTPIATVLSEDYLEDMN